MCQFSQLGRKRRQERPTKYPNYEDHHRSHSCPFLLINYDVCGIREICGHGSLHCLLRVEAREHARNQRRGNFGAKGLCSGVKKVENILKLLSVIIWNSTSKRSLNMCAVHLCLLPACFAESLFWTGAPLCVTLLGWKPSADLCHICPIGRCPVSPTFSNHSTTYRRHVASHSFHDLTDNKHDFSVCCLSTHGDFAARPIVDFTFC